MQGAHVLARALKEQHVDFMFGVVGIPVIEVSIFAQVEDVKYIGFRNEQAASYAAGAVGYMTGRPGACLCVSGPGMVHGLAGLSNAWSNCWPMILIGGASDASQDGQGAFQECPQIAAARPFSKLAIRIDRIGKIPQLVELAVRTAINGRPGPVYLDIPGDVLQGKYDESLISWPLACPEPPLVFADPKAVADAYRLLQSAKRPLIIVGKGAAYARAEEEVRSFVHDTHIPFLPTPMGKGVVPDDDPHCVAAARTFALSQADVILLIGARLNWILHFGLPPRFDKDVKVIQIDISGEEIGTNVPASVPLVGHAKAIMSQLNEFHRAQKQVISGVAKEWMEGLKNAQNKNLRTVESMCADQSVPMTYYRVFDTIRKQLKPDDIIVSEGANTMDIGRGLMHNYLPRHRLDAGTFGTMGVGLGFAVAAACVFPNKRIIAVEGDSAFGFSGMEFEVMCRYQLPVTIIIVNNNGIYSGISEPADPAFVPPLSLTVNAHYEMIADCFGGDRVGAKGYFVRTPQELDEVVPRVLAEKAKLVCGESTGQDDTVVGPTIINIMINPVQSRKKQKFEWLTRKQEDQESPSSSKL